MTGSPASTNYVSSTTNYVAISRRTLDLEDYIDVARRHVSWIVGPMLAGIVIAIVVAFALPNVYISQAEMQITPAQISENIVKTTINQQLTERIMQMENEILSRTSLSNIIQDPRLDLYKSDRAGKPIEDVIEAMRTNIKIKIDALPGDGLRRASAFSIAFSYPDRTKAQQTVQALVTKFQDSNLTTQATQQKVVNNYVHDELSEAKVKLDQLNEQLTKFRVQNSGKLPEQSNLNVAQLTALQQQSTTINDGLNRLAQERVQLDQRETTLQGQIDLFNMFDKESGPTVPVSKRQNDRLLEMNRNIENIETQLAQMHQLYKAGYPDIRDAEARLQVLRTERDDLQKKQDDEQVKLEEAANAQKAPAKKATNFASAQSLSNLQGQIDATRALVKANEMQRASVMKQQQTVNKAIDEYQAKLAATSGIEAGYAEMVANQRAATEKYQVLQSKQELTEQNGELLSRKAGENLDVLDPPSLPASPAKPNRWMIVGAGGAISLILGVALAGIQEAKDTSLKNLKDVRAYTNLPVLSSIPLLENTLLVRRKRRMAYLAWSAAIIVGMLAISFSLYYHYTSPI
jgi:succinoglycan biosynthesis transport protein ExoP